MDEVLDIVDSMNDKDVESLIKNMKDDEKINVVESPVVVPVIPAAPIPKPISDSEFTVEQQIAFWQPHFKVLKGWTFKYDPNREFYGIRFEYNRKSRIITLCKIIEDVTGTHILELLMNVCFLEMERYTNKVRMRQCQEEITQDWVKIMQTGVWTQFYIKMQAIIKIKIQRELEGVQ